MNDKIVKIKFVVTVGDIGWNANYEDEGEAKLEIDMPISAIEYMETGSLLSSLLPAALTSHLDKIGKENENG